MPRRRGLLLIEILLFVMATLFGLAIGYVAKMNEGAPVVLQLFRWGSLPITVALLIATAFLMTWKNRIEQRENLPRIEWDSNRSPFPGLEAFTEEDAEVFFGREMETINLLNRLHPALPDKAHRLIAVVGPSGVGKSSLVHAGLVPRLKQKRRDWIIVPTIVPGNRPVKNLALVLAMVLPGRFGSQPSLVSNKDESLILHSFTENLHTVRHGQPSPVLIVIDQAEELVTMTGQREREEFLSLLETMLVNDSRLWVIMVMRSEFLTAFLESSAAHLFYNPVAIGGLSRAALVEVIERPAIKAGMRFDPPALPQEIAIDTGGGQVLPLLAYTMQEIYLEVGPGGTITLDSYRRLGGVTGVLARQADKVTAELCALDPSMPILQTLLKFVTIGENEPTRHRVPRSSLSEIECRIADSFISARLLTSDVPPGDNTEEQNAMLEVAHEALFRHWTPLRQEIEAHKDELQWRADLERWTHDWERFGRQDAYLLRNEQLKAAQQWASNFPDLTMTFPAIAEYLDHSRRADQATMKSLSETISRQALAEIGHDPAHSLRLALVAYDECGPTSLARQALTTALIASHVRAILRCHQGSIFGVAWSPDGRRLATASVDRTIRIWDVERGAELTALYGHDNGVNGVAWSPDGQRLATASDDRTARIWDLQQNKEITILQGHENRVRGLAWSPDGRFLATASEDRTARIWDLQQNKETAILQGHEDRIWRVAWSPDGQRLATASDDRTARIWDLQQNKETAILQGHEDRIWTVAWSPDGQRLATASDDRTARIWDLQQNKEVTILRGHEDRIRGLAWSPDGQRLATASDDRTARIWDTHKSKEIVTILRCHQKRVRGVTWSPDSRCLATASEDRTARIWDLQQNKETAILQGHDGWVLDVAWSPDGRFLATASHDHTARIWDLQQNKETAILQGHQNTVRGVTWSPDGRFLATASEDRTARIWDLQQNKEITILRSHEDRIRGLAWSPDGQRLATASDDHTARIWDLQQNKEITMLQGHQNIVRAVTWSPDGRRLATTSDDHAVRIWDGDRGTELLVIGVLEDHSHKVAWSPDGHYIATGSGDGTIQVWNARISIDSILTMARSHALRPLTAEERQTLMLPQAL